MKKQSIRLNVNNEPYEVWIQPHMTLVELLRDELDLTGTKEGCGLGICGSCTVLMNGQPIRSCLTLAMEADGSRITTIEGLSVDDTLDPLQNAYIEHGAVQCGFCTSGMIMASKALLTTCPHPDEATVRKAISGNICRCTGYAKIVKAVLAASKK